MHAQNGDVYEHYNVAQSRDTAHHWCMSLTLRVCALRKAVALGSMSYDDRRLRYDMHHVRARENVACHDDNVAERRSQPSHCMLVANLQCVPHALRACAEHGALVSSNVPYGDRGIQ